MKLAILLLLTLILQSCTTPQQAPITNIQAYTFNAYENNTLIATGSFSIPDMSNDKREYGTWFINPHINPTTAKPFDSTFSHGYGFYKTYTQPNKFNLPFPFEIHLNAGSTNRKNIQLPINFNKTNTKGQWKTSSCFSAKNIGKIVITGKTNNHPQIINSSFNVAMAKHYKKLISKITNKDKKKSRRFHQRSFQTHITHQILQSKTNSKSKNTAISLHKSL